MATTWEPTTCIIMSIQFWRAETKYMPEFPYKSKAGFNAQKCLVSSLIFLIDHSVMRKNEISV